MSFSDRVSKFGGLVVLSSSTVTVAAGVWIFITSWATSPVAGIAFEYRGEANFSASRSTEGSVQVAPPAPDTPPDSTGSTLTPQPAISILRYVVLNPGAWVSFQHLQPITDDEQRWQACPDRFAERLIARHLYDRIMRLPDPEYLHDVDNYIGDHAKQPLRFRFRCGDGVVMPMEGQDDD